MEDRITIDICDGEGEQNIVEQIMIKVTETKDEFVFQTLQKWITNQTQMIISKSDLLEALKLLKSVVRCKNCHYYKGNGWCNRSGIHLEVNDDWFCADGTREQ